ncbi:helix-turn-helix transcriptional regulator [Actinoplanes sp. M2I2]|uniref:helix-turn-helix transcriptional regulator n=1 Tax=Actinoplanes sp. M2I2 TaxID=1734444 RepID=UPI0020207A31|nr:helix-turn-helix transcriptional regulator [Actinoplanes sp. M2I2]
MDPIAVRLELAAFLKNRRERLDPRELGLPHNGRRRTPGLRRQEVAQLAGMSVDYYTRLEQARDLHPSVAVLDALTRALRLTSTERDHLHRLARAVPATRRAPATELVRPSLLRVVTGAEPNPALVLGRSYDVLAWNRTAAALIADFDSIPPARRNMARLFFLETGMRTRYAEWEHVARDTVAFVRSAAARYPDDPAMAGLIAELLAESADFRRLWPRLDVQERTVGTKRFVHPQVGPVVLDYETLAVPESDLTLIVYSAPVDSPGQAAIELLGALSSVR